LRLRSCPGHGSTFKLLIPLAGKQSFQSPDVVDAGSVGDLVGLRVAYVDDDSLLLNATHDLMKRWGIEVTITESISEFRIMVAAEKQFDVILMDYQLGEGANGLELLELYRREVSHDFIGILATAKQNEELVSEVERAGFKFLAKPLGPARLRSVLQSCVR
jgi:CheY-like chemotaxis protein